MDYLNYIIDNYYNLPEIVSFIDPSFSGSIEDLKNQAKEFGFSQNLEAFECSDDFKTKFKNLLRYDPPNVVYRHAQNTFVTTRFMIKNRPKTYYIYLKSVYDPEFFESAWLRIYGGHLYMSDKYR